MKKFFLAILFSIFMVGVGHAGTVTAGGTSTSVYDNKPTAVLPYGAIKRDSYENIIATKAAVDGYKTTVLENGKIVDTWSLVIIAKFNGTQVSPAIQQDFATAKSCQDSADYAIHRNYIQGAWCMYVPKRVFVH